MQGALRLWQVEVAVRVAVWDHLIGLDVRLDREDRFSVLLGIPFVSFKLTIWRD